MKYNIILISIYIIFVCKMIHTHVAFPENKKEIQTCGIIIDIKQVTSESGRINNYIYQKLNNNEVKKIKVTDTCYYNWRNKIGKEICFNDESEEYNDTSCHISLSIILLVIWLFITFIAWITTD